MCLDHKAAPQPLLTHQCRLLGVKYVDQVDVGIPLQPQHVVCCSMQHFNHCRVSQEWPQQTQLVVQGEAVYEVVNSSCKKAASLQPNKLLASTCDSLNNTYLNQEDKLVTYLLNKYQGLICSKCASLQ